MVDTSATSHASDLREDPSLDLLVPKASPTRNLAFFAVALFLLIGAWFSPSVLRAEIRDLGSGSSTAFESTRQVLTTTRLDPSETGDVTIESVGEVPGATLAGAWVLQYRNETVDDVEELVPPPQPEDPFEDIAARYPGQELSSANELPQRVEGDSQDSEANDDIELVLLWTVADCSQLSQSARPSMVLKTAIGTTVQQPLDPFSGPAWDISGLNERGVC